jgi:hypothetical protein
MKKLVLMAILVVLSTSTFASKKKDIVKDKNAIISQKNIVRIKTNESATINKVFFKECFLSIHGTVGKRRIDLEVSYTADDCAAGAIKIIKGLLK